jgi:hypothetical protein
MSSNAVQFIDSTPLAGILTESLNAPGKMLSMAASAAGSAASRVADVCGSLGIAAGSMSALWSPSTAGNNGASLAAATPAVEMSAPVNEALPDGVAHVCPSNIGAFVPSCGGAQAGALAYTGR